MAETLELRAEVIDLPEHVSSNIAALQAACLDMAETYAAMRPVETAEDYRQMKRDRTAVRAALRQVDDERKRVKSAWMHPYVEFEAAVKASTEALAEVEAKQKRFIAEFEDAGREAKRKRLEAYWEQAYPALALCTGESDEPLVPFSRVFDPDWTRRIGELDEGRDGKATGAMDAIAAKLADGERMIDSLNAPDDLKVSAKERMFETLDPVAAAHGIEVEARRRRDIERLRAARAASIAEVTAATPVPEEVLEKVPGTEPIPPAQPVTRPERRYLSVEMPAGASVPEGCGTALVVWCATKDELEKAKGLFKDAGLHGFAGRISR